MTNETGGIGIEDIGGGIREDVNKVTEEALRRVQDNQKKAQQVAQQIQKDKAINDKLAQFLIFLLKSIQNEQIISTLYQAFFKTKDNKTGLVHLRGKINTIVIVGMFAPFYPKKVQELGLETTFASIPQRNTNPSVTSYITYLKGLSKTHHDNIPMNKEDLIEFLTEILIHYQLAQIDPQNKEEKKALKNSLLQTLYKQ